MELGYRPLSRTLDLYLAMAMEISLQVAALDGEMEDTGEIRSGRTPRLDTRSDSQEP